MASDLVRFIDDRRSHLSVWTGSRGAADRMILALNLEITKNGALAACAPVSVYTALIAITQMGLDLNPFKGSAYIVPYKGVATPIPGYRGLVNLAQRSGVCPRAELVYEHDVYEHDMGSEPRITHRPAPFGKDRGALIGGYACATVNEALVSWRMSLDELEAVRKAAKRGSKETPAWAEHTEAMYRKTLLRRICKLLPLGDADFHAHAIDAAVSAARLRDYGEAVLRGPLSARGPLPADLVEEMDHVIDVTEESDADQEVYEWRMAMLDVQTVEALQEMRQSPDWKAMRPDVAGKVGEIYKERLQVIDGSTRPGDRREATGMDGRPDARSTDG